MPGIYFKHTELMPTIHPGIEAVVAFLGLAVIDELGNEVKITKLVCAIVRNDANCAPNFEPCSIPSEDSPRMEDQKFLSTIKDAARKKYAQILKKVDSLN